MRTYFYIIVSFLCLVIMGCSSDEGKVPSEDEHVYYVKYEYYMPLDIGSQAYTSRDVWYISENGEQFITTSKAEWEATFGPVKEGDHLYIWVEAKKGGIRNNVEYYAKLYVSCDNGPFVLKSEDRGVSTSMLYAEYKIEPR